MPRFRRKDDPIETEERHDFAALDTADRKIGGIVITWEEPDGRFGFRPHASRDGRAYGPTQWGETYATKADRDHAIDAYLTTARRAAQLLRGRRQ